MPLGDRLPRYCIADLVVDVGRRSVGRGASEIHVSKLSFDVLQALIEAAPNVVSNDQLTRAVWRGVVVGPESVTQRIKLLRDALGDDPEAPEAVLKKYRDAFGDSAAYQYAAIYAQWGNTAKALEWLATAMRERDAGLQMLKVDSLMDPLRNEPRFQAIERSLKFPG